MRPIIVIPSRLASTRLPRKALADIAGVTMIERVVQQALKADLGPVVVAAGDAEIMDAVSEYDSVTAILTDPALSSGSDRVQAALEEIDSSGDYDCVINLQGDLPLIEPDILHNVLKPLDDPFVDVGTLVTSVRTPEECAADSVVKVACAFKNPEDCAYGLYFSRVALPWGDGPFWHHIGVYAWRREALNTFVSLPQTMLEKRERLEQLRALEAGMIIGCVQVDKAPFGVDTPDDLERVRGIICR